LVTDSRLLDGKFPTKLFLFSLILSIGIIAPEHLPICIHIRKKGFSGFLFHLFYDLSDFT